MCWTDSDVVPDAGGGGNVWGERKADHQSPFKIPLSGKDECLHILLCQHTSSHVAISTQIFDCKSGSSACCWHLKRYQVFTKDSGIQPLGTRNDKASVDVEIFRSGQK